MDFQLFSVKFYVNVIDINSIHEYGKDGGIWSAMHYWENVQPDHFRNRGLLTFLRVHPSSVK